MPYIVTIGKWNEDTWRYDKRKVEANTEADVGLLVYESLKEGYDRIIIVPPDPDQKEIEARKASVRDNRR